LLHSAEEENSPSCRLTESQKLECIRAEHRVDRVRDRRAIANQNAGPGKNQIAQHAE
jgi:hypothetical protein